MSSFDLVSPFQPAGDQPAAIAELVKEIRAGTRQQILLGVTGSGKTFTAANVIAQVDKPTLILSPNKILAAQLYSEFKQFFPNNAVEYFISYYDYYQPEAYVPSPDTLITPSTGEKRMAFITTFTKICSILSTSAIISGKSDGNSFTS